MITVQILGHWLEHMPMGVMLVQASVLGRKRRQSAPSIPGTPGRYFGGRYFGGRYFGQEDFG